MCKPRPALVIQSDRSTCIAVNPIELNGLAKPSQVMVDKPQVTRDKAGAVDDETMLAVSQALAVFLGFA